MEEEINKKQRGVIGTIIVVLLLILILALILWRQNDGEAGETTAVFSTTTVTLTFSELNEDPQQYRDQRIRVTGDYAPVQPLTCAQEREFGAAWRLIGEELALQAQGLEPLLRLVPSATTLTVEGIWRKYEGLVGCTPGEIGVIWYLQAETIVEPNPLTNLVGTLPPTALPLTVLPLPEGTTATATPTEATPSATPIMTTAVTITPTPTTDQFVTASPTSSTPTTNVTPSGTPASGTTPTFTATPTRIDPSRTVSPTPTPTTTATAAVATIPPTATLPSFATATPGSGYPGQPINTPVPIATPVPPTAYP